MSLNLNKTENPYENGKAEKTADKVRSRMGIRILFYLGGFLIMTMGIAFSIKSNLGVSPVSSIPYSITLIWGMDIGISTVVLHASLVLIQLIVLRKDFKVKNLLQIPVGIIFGLFTTLCKRLVELFPTTDNMGIRIVLLLLSTLFIAVGIFFYVPADIMPLAGEGVILAISQKSKIKFSTVKVFFDVTMVLISIAACLIALHSFGSVGVGTVVAAVIVGLEVKLVTKLFGKARDKALGKKSSTG